MPTNSMHRAKATVASLIACCGLAACSSSGGGGMAQPGDVSGRYVLTISDADMTAPAVVTNQLGERDLNVSDTMTIVQLPITEPQTPYAQVPVSNSVLGPPQQVAVTPDGRLAFVVESRGPAPSGATTIDDLPPGQRLTMIDLTSLAAPIVVDEMDLNDTPGSVAVHPDGTLVALTTSTPGHQIVILPIEETGEGGRRLGSPMAWEVMGLDSSEALASTINFSPSGNIVAITLPERDEVMFYEFTRAAQLEGGATGFGLAPIGEPVHVGKFPYSGQFTPDGRYFITTDLQWGENVEDYLVGAPEGTLTVVRVPTVQSSDGEAAFSGGEVVSRLPVGISPEGLAISRDGKYVVTANLRRSFLPEEDPRLTRGGSVSLLSLSNSGELSPAGEYELDGMPEGVCFDAADRFVVVTQFRSFDPRAVDGELAFLELDKGSNPTLKMTDFRLGVGKGPHGVLIVR
ncbi:MAG: hypothetical protein H7Y88_11930 [Phycisphaerales bacterium]|nr:hypothetical protein [Phycisphaerales bacterium]